MSSCGINDRFVKDQRHTDQNVYVCWYLGDIQIGKIIHVCKTIKKNNKQKMTTICNSVHVLCLGITQQCVSGISGPVPLHWQLHKGYKT